MIDNPMAIAIFCSQLCKPQNTEPFENTEWAKISATLRLYEKTPLDLLSMEETALKSFFPEPLIKRIHSLIDRQGKLSSSLERYKSMGISLVTLADTAYPSTLKKSLGSRCPPLFYVAGELSLCEENGIGFVGSREIQQKDELFTRDTVGRVVAEGYSVVSGGAAGVDSIAVDEAVKRNGVVVEFISHSLVNKLSESSINQEIFNKKRVIFSLGTPEIDFREGLDMNRNQCIYAHSQLTLVVRSDYEKGNTWLGAKEALSWQESKVCCWNNLEYLGNQELIRLGALPISQGMSWEILPKPEYPEQMSLFCKYP